MSEEKTFKVPCFKCRKIFHKTYEIEELNAEGKADVWVECPYCNEKQMIKIPRKYVAADTPILRHE